MLTADHEVAPDHPARPPSRWSRWSRPAIVTAVVALASACITWSVVVGWDVQAAEPRVRLGAAPLVGEWRRRLGPALVPAVVLAAAAVALLPRLSSKLPFGRVLLLVGAWGAALCFALAASDGWDAVLAPVVHPTEYWANLATLPPAGETLRSWSVEFLLDYSVHVKGHPPGFVLLLQALDSVGLGRPWVAGALSFAGAAAAPVAVLVVTRAVAGEASARRAAPFLVPVPYLVWMGTSADAFFTAVTAWGIAAALLALRSSTPAGRRVLAAVAGVTLALGLFLTYGTVTLLVVPVVLVLALPGVAWRARAEVAAVAGAGAGAVTLAFAVAGFWWLDGLRTTQTLYWWGSAQFRPGDYFLYANLAAAMIAVGPAVVVGMAALRDRRVWLVVGAALASLLVADVSQYSKAEVERIWLLFYPWLVPAVVALRRVQPWLAVQALVTVGLQAVLVSKW